MEDKQKICDNLLPTLQATASLSALVDLEYIVNQEKVVATIGADVKHIDVNGYSGEMMIIHIIEKLLGLEE